MKNRQADSRVASGNELEARVERAIPQMNAESARNLARLEPTLLEAREAVRLADVIYDQIRRLLGFFP